MYVQQFKYLGQIFDNSLSDDADINRGWDVWLAERICWL